MSNDFAVEYGALEQYGTSMEGITTDAITSLAAVSVDSPTRSMPGGLASGAASLLRGRWEAAVRRTSEHMMEHPARLLDNAAAYRDMEDEAEGIIAEFFGAT